MTITFRTGTHNPYTLYGGPADAGARSPFEVPLGFICDERAALLAAEAMTACACLACPWGCGSCTLNRATCECYEHQDCIDEDGQPVEGSTPIASPARAAFCGDVAPSLLNDGRPTHCTLPAGHATGWHENDETPPMCWTLRDDTAVFQPAPAGEVVSVPPPVVLTREELIEASMAVVEEVAYWRRQETIAPIGVRSYTDSREAAMELARSYAGRLWTAGVEEGRRQRDEEIHADVLNSARQVAREAGFGPGPDSLSVTYETEERTEEQHAEVTVKGCLGGDSLHGKRDIHYWRCSTPGCPGHLCRPDGLTS